MQVLIAGIIVLSCSAAFADDNRRAVDVWPGGGVFPQVVDSSEWKTTFYFHNMEATPIYVGVLFADDKGQPLALPTRSGQQTVGAFLSMRPNATASFETNGEGPLKQGWAIAITCDRPCSDPASIPVQSKLGAFAVFRWRAAGRPDTEAVVPMEMPDTIAHVVFDNRQGYGTGVALLNFSTSSDTIAVTVRDESGTVISQENIQMGDGEKKVFMVADRYGDAANKQGCIEFSGGSIVAMGLRATPAGSLTSSHAMIPAAR